MPEDDHVAEHAAPEEPSKAVISSRLYDVLKVLAQVVLPALGTLYFALATTWGLPNAGQVVGSITAVDAFLGVLVTYLKAKYDGSDAKFDGALIKGAIGEGERTVALQGLTANTIESKSEILLKVKE